MCIRDSSYALYTPENDSHKNALVIWNHGVGETGTDVQIDLLGNEVTALAGDEFQNTMDGAYVLVPQRRSYDSTSNAEAIYQLILKTLRENPDIDQDRIIIGGDVYKRQQLIQWELECVVVKLHHAMIYQLLLVKMV